MAAASTMKPRSKSAKKKTSEGKRDVSEYGDVSESRSSSRPKSATKRREGGGGGGTGAGDTVTSRYAAEWGGGGGGGGGGGDNYPTARGLIRK